MLTAIPFNTSGVSWIPGLVSCPGGRTTKYQLPYMCCAVSLLPHFVRDTRQLSHRGESSSSEREEHPCLLDMPKAFSEHHPG